MRSLAWLLICAAVAADAQSPGTVSSAPVGGVISPGSLVSGSDARPPPPPPARGPTLKVAQALAQAALDHCRAAGLNVSAVVIDSGGYVKVSLMADGAISFTPAFGARKANTALAFKMNSGEVEALGQNDATVAERLRNDATMFAHPGALLLKVNDEIIGVLAVSGARGEQDEACARAALTRYQRRLK